MIKKLIKAILILCLLAGFDMKTMKVRITKTVEIVCGDELTGLGGFNTAIEHMDDNGTYDQEKVDEMKSLLKQAREETCKHLNKS